MSRKFCSIIIVLFVILSAINTGSFAQDNDKNIEKLVKKMHNQSRVFVAISKKTTPAVVNITVVRKMKGFSGNNMLEDEFFRRFFGDRLPRNFKRKGRKRREYKQRGMGSGVIVDPRGYILSNNHVVRDADEVIIKLSDKREFKAKIVGTDAKTDIAVLKIDAKNLVVAPMGNSDNISVGQWVLAIGNPFGLTQTVTAGIISAKGRANVGIADYEDFLQTDAAINPGNSGGPLVNLHGEVIGINTAILSRSGGYQGIGFAIPINMAKAVMNQIINKGKVVRGWLGVRIQEITADLAKTFGLEESNGALIADVVPGSPAEKGGLEQGDVILYYNGVKVRDINRLRNMVAATTIGETVPVKVIRNGSVKILYITIGDLSKAQQGFSGVASAEKTSKELAELGLEVSNLTPELAKQYGYKKASGIIVTGVKTDSLAEQYGLKKGDLIVAVNQIRVKNISTLRKALKRSKSRILLLVRSGGISRFIVIRKR